MSLGTQTLVNKPSKMPSSCGATRAGDGSVVDQFPAGLRVLVVDDDPTCLMILEKMLRNCNYDATKCNRAEVALSLLRENKNGFDVVISDVHMPVMDGFKLLEHIGLEMDLPVIMMSADDSKCVVMKGVTHGACDYLIKPVRIEALRNIWQHVVRKKKHEWKDVSLDQQPDKTDYSSSANEGHNWENAKKRKHNESEDRDKSSSLKNPRVVWSAELHQQFVAAVVQLGIDNAVPKKIVDRMNVPGLTRANVASHLQKYRLYLRRLGGSHQSGDGGSPLSDLDLVGSGQLSHLPAQSLAALQAMAPCSKSTNSKSPLPVPLQRNIFSFENPKLSYPQGQNGNTTMELKQHSFGGMMNSQSQAVLPKGMVATAVYNSYPLRGNLGISLVGDGNIEDKISRQGCVPSYDLLTTSNQKKSNNWGLTNGMQDVLQHNYGLGEEGSTNNSSEDDLLTVIRMQQQEGFGQVESEFDLDWCALDNLPV